MKISKRQLKRIIREEKRRILREMGSGHHGGMYGNPGDWGDPNQWDAEVQEEDFCPYSYLEKMKALHPGDYAVDAKLPQMGVDPDTGRELTDEEMQMVWDVIDEEQSHDDWEETNPEPQLQPGVEPMFGYQGDGSNMNASFAGRRMRESRKITKRQLKRIIREEKRRLIFESQIEAEATDIYDQLLNIVGERGEISVAEASERFGKGVGELEMMLSSPAMSKLEVINGMIQYSDDDFGGDLGGDEPYIAMPDYDD